MSVTRSNRIMVRILAGIGCIVLLMLLILLARGCGKDDSAIVVTPTVQGQTEEFIEEETGYRLLSGSRTAVLRLRLVDGVEIWEGTDEDGVSLMLVCDASAREYHFIRNGTYLSRGSYRGRNVWEGGKTVFLLYENGVHNADSEGFRALEYTALSGSDETDDLSEIRLTLPDVWYADLTESTDGQ